MPHPFGSANINKTTGRNLNMVVRIVWIVRIVSQLVTAFGAM